ncbi:MAG: ABC transporter permease [Acidimicrobiales bacterium]
MVAISRVGDAVRSPFFPIWPATVVLFALSPLVASGSLGTTALTSTLPFAAVLAIAAMGQTLVIQQRGLDLSVAGTISLATIIVTKYPNGANSGLLLAIGATLLACALTGAVNGFVITRLRITPLIATLGTNALLLGVILIITSGSSTATPAPALTSLGFDKLWGVPHSVLIALVLVVIVAAAMRVTALGRRFVAVGTNAAGAYVAGIGVRRYVWGTYVAASVCYGIAAILLAAYVGTPGLSAGTSYLLPSITVVVLGGASLAGGSGSVVGSAIGAIFLIQLQQDVFGTGAATSVQYLIQAGVIAAAMALRSVHWRAVVRRLPFWPPSAAADRHAPRGTVGTTLVPASPDDDPLHGAFLPAVAESHGTAPQPNPRSNS